MPKLLKLLFVLVATAALAASVSFAQMNVAEIVGVVTDPDGDIVVAVTVTATNTATGLEASAVTSQAGEYRIPELAPGVYIVSAVAQGFKQAIRLNLALHAGEQTDVKLSMVVGEPGTGVRCRSL